MNQTLPPKMQERPIDRFARERLTPVGAPPPCPFEPDSVPTDATPPQWDLTYSVGEMAVWDVDIYHALARWEGYGDHW